ncbi:MAG: alanine--tRNA ligase [Eubacteriales bacterium]
MEWTGLNELREKYLSFFEGKGHLRLPSFPLVPQGDKSLLLINAGMAPLKKYFTGELIPPDVRLTTCQKCIRTPDIERVGKTSRHGTYFEMLGNFSFGDYFKREAIFWAWEFCTKVIEMSPEKLFISVYIDDDEAYEIWTKEVEIPSDHMIRLGKEDNFWEHGAGPCGPCSEIYYDRGEKYGCGSSECKVGCDCDRYVEFWNLVFTQFLSDGAGNYANLANCNIDTGMGLERIACISQMVDNLFEVDTVQNIMKHVINIAGVGYREDEKVDVSLRVITDHIRSTTFMVGDGVMPSNEGRGYVLRRLLRRAARHGRLLGIEHPFLSEVCETVIRENMSAYPNLVEKHDFIVKVIEVEEENFGRTIDLGLQLLEQMIEVSDSTILRAADAFKLSDTFGFPIDLTKEILSEKGMIVDEDEFSCLIIEQRERARNARNNASAYGRKDVGIVTKGLPLTEFCGYSKLDIESKIEAIVIDEKLVEYLESGVDATLILDKTTFYAESGGQVGDVGIITNDDCVFEVSSTTKTNEGFILHYGLIIKGEGLKTGDFVCAKVDKTARSATQRNHTAAHLLQAVLRNVLGNHVEQAGQLVGPNLMRFDFTYFSALTSEKIKAVERQVNDIVFSSVPVSTTEMPINEAKKIGAIALFGEKYGEMVRVVKSGDFSTELCGGTHVNNSGELGLFKIISESSVAAGVRRIEALTGFGTLNYIYDNEKLITNTARSMKINNVHEIDHRAAGLMIDLKNKDKEIDNLNAKLSLIEVKSIMENARMIGAVNLITAVINDSSVEEIRSYCDVAKASGTNVVVVIAGINNEKGLVNFAVACAHDAIQAGAHAGNIIKSIAVIAGGSGGGRQDSAMAGTKDVSKVIEAITAVDEIVKKMLK